MSLHKSRGASLVEYALILFVFIGGAAAAAKGTGVSVRDVFGEAATTTLSSESIEIGQADLRTSPDRRDGGSR